VGSGAKGGNREKKKGKSHFYKIFFLIFLEAKKWEEFLFSCFLPVIVDSLLTPADVL